MVHIQKYNTRSKQTLNVKSDKDDSDTDPSDDSSYKIG